MSHLPEIANIKTGKQSLKDKVNATLKLMRLVMDCIDKPYMWSGFDGHNAFKGSQMECQTDLSNNL